MYQETPPYVATEWKQLYSAVLSQSDNQKRQWLIRQLEQAIRNRYNAAGGDLDPDEIREMAEAVWNLLQLRRENNAVA